MRSLARTTFAFSLVLAAIGCGAGPSQLRQGPTSSVQSTPPARTEASAAGPRRGSRPTETRIRHDATGTCFPTPFGSLEMVDARTYSDDRSDASVELDDRETGLAASIYVYPVAAYRTGASFDAHFQEVVTFMNSHFGATVQRTESLVDARFQDPGRHAIAAFSRNGEAWSTEAILFRRGGFYYKARFTFPSAAESRVRPMIARILAESFSPCEPGSLQVLLGADGEPRTDSQLAAIAQRIRRMERSPSTALGSFSARIEFARVLRWVVATHDVHVVVRPWATVLTSGEARELPQLMGAATMGMAAFMIERRGQHPDPAGDDAQIAGIESVAHYYEAALSDGAAHVPALDEILAHRDRNALSEWLAAH